MIAVIDNYDSFTYNLVQRLGELEKKILVFRNDKITSKKLFALNPSHILISPGPCTPKEAGNTNEIILQCGKKIPILGVCLGHQCIAEVFGAKVVPSGKPVHGKTSLISHDRKTIYRQLPNPFVATRYHSLIVLPDLPDCLQLSAWSNLRDNGKKKPSSSSSNSTVMGIRHKQFPIEGVQFHPESFLTTAGKRLLKNFVDYYG